MSSPDDFSVQLRTAIESKASWFDSTELPDLLENYRLLHTCVKTLADVLEKRRLVVADPYKGEKKITTIKAPENTAFSESDRAKIIGQRLSDYESMLDYICTYYKFSTNSITISELKKISDLSNSFQWDNLSSNNTSPNSAALAVLLGQARQQTTGITMSNITDAMNRSSQAMTRIGNILRELSEFVREKYKLNIRETIIANDKFNKEKAMSSQDAEFAEIKRLYPELIGKKSFYSDLIYEIAAEDIGMDKDERRALALARLAPKVAASKKKVETVDTKELILGAVSVLAGAAPQYSEVVNKLEENNKILNTVKNTFMEKLKEALRKMFGIPRKAIDYTLTIVDQKTQTKKTKKLEFTSFIANLDKRQQLYAALASKQTAEYNKIKAASEDAILSFIEKQIHENQEILVLLSALDDFFKTNAASENRQNIKGLKMEMTSLKNCIVKTNQKRVDYTSYKEEQAQMEKLGI